MRPAHHPFRKLVLVCTNERTDGRECCAQKDSLELHRQLKEAVKAVAPDIRVSKCGCLDNCASGAVVVIMPENVWLGDVTCGDIPELVKRICA